MKKWDIQNKLTVESSSFTGEFLIDVLLENRNVRTKEEREEFLNPQLDNVTIDSVGIDKTQLKKTLKRIQKAIDTKEQIVVYGDYDVDGICGSAILWETLYGMGALVVPYIPHRMDEGYGLSIRGIENLKSKISDIKLVITVDNGIVANEAVEFANKQGIDVIITDHHVASDNLPKAYSTVHTTKLCGTGVGWMLSKELKAQNEKGKTKDETENHLELVALATIADLVPLTGANRTVTKFGLERLRKTKRVGLIELFKEAALDVSTIGVYEVGHLIAPRLNAMGRLEFAMDSLRLICTKDPKRAEKLAMLLGQTNRDRQVLTKESADHAVLRLKTQDSKLKSLLFISHESYQEGVIGLIAGRLVEEFYRPAIVVSIGGKVSKASARSVHGFNIIEFIRLASDHLINAGGHPMAAGFSVETEKLSLLQEFLEEISDQHINVDLLTRTLRIDCQIPLQIITAPLYRELQTLAPFGMGNPEPTFVSTGVTIEDIRLIGKDRNHVKFCVSLDGSRKIDCIGFSISDQFTGIHGGDTIDIVYTIDENEWNGKKNLQLKIKDIKNVTA